MILALLEDFEHCCISCRIKPNTNMASVAVSLVAGCTLRKYYRKLYVEHKLEYSLEYAEGIFRNSRRVTLAEAMQYLPEDTGVIAGFLRRHRKDTQGFKETELSNRIAASKPLEEQVLTLGDISVVLDDDGTILYQDDDIIVIPKDLVKDLFTTLQFYLDTHK